MLFAWLCSCSFAGLKAGKGKEMIAVETRGLSVGFGEREVLLDISCKVHEREFVAVLGPNGAGKSVFLKVLLGLLPPAAGEVAIFGRRPLDIPPGWIGYVPQVKTLDRNFPALAVELVVTGLHHSWKRWLSKGEKKSAMESLARVGASHLADRSVSALSGGELQRVYLARCLVQRPRLLILDEPVTGVDMVAENDFYQVLEEFRRENEATIVMVTHDWEVAANYACHVLVLNQRLISFGTPAEALCDDCLKKAYGTGRDFHLVSCPRPRAL